MRCPHVGTVTMSRAFDVRNRVTSLTHANGNISWEDFLQGYRFGYVYGHTDTHDYDTMDRMTLKNSQLYGYDAATQRFLELAIPQGATATQMQQISEAIEAAIELGVRIITKIIR